MSTEPNQPASDEADPDKQSTPAGMTDELESEAAEAGATTDADEATAPDVDERT